MKENKFIKILNERLNNPVQADADEYPVYFDEGADFMGTGITIHGFGEILGCCSQGLLDECEVNPTLKLIIWDSVRRFLLDDMGEGGADIAKRAYINYHEGLKAHCIYETPLLKENEFILSVDELGHPENPRCIYALLPSEEQAINEWFSRHPEEKAENVKGYYGMYFTH